MKSSKPPAFIHVDVDSDRSLGNFYGDRMVTSTAVYDGALPRLLSLFASQNTIATFFICGSDLTEARHRRLVRSLVAAGHEIASHSLSHPNGFIRLPRAKRREEIIKNIDVLRKVTGLTPAGFRAPGYDVDASVIADIARAGHRYDSSLYPSILHPLLKMVLRIQRPSVDSGYGPTQNAWARTTIHQWRGLWELPVSVFPIVRFPFHSHITSQLPDQYLTSGLSLLRFLRRPVVFLFHAVEIVDEQHDAIALSVRSHPVFRVPFSRRIEHAHTIIRKLQQHFSIRRTDHYIESLDGTIGTQ